MIYKLTHLGVGSYLNYIHSFVTQTEKSLVFSVRLETANPPCFEFFEILFFRATFTSSSRVMSLTFDPFKDNIIIGGCYSGQICIWDVRVNKKMPVYKVFFLIFS